MTSRRMLALTALASGVVIAVVSWILPAEPQFEGRPLRAWMDSGSEPAAVALHALGRRAIPSLISRIRWEHPRWGYWRRYQLVWEKLPVAARAVMHRPKAAIFDEERACAAFLEIGPSAFPALLKAMHDSNPGVRAAGVFTLEAFHRNGWQVRAGQIRPPWTGD